MSGDVDFGRLDEPGDSVIAPSIADSIRADVAARRRRVVLLTHPDAPAWRLTFELPLDREVLAPLFARAEAAAKASRAKKGRTASFPLDAAILGRCNVRIDFQGEVLEDGGEPLTVRDRAVLDMLEVESPSAAIKAIYAADGVVSSLSEKLLQLAGYKTTDEVDEDLDDEGEPDPTPAG